MSHSHLENSHSADGWTNFNAFAEGATSLVSDAYWAASSIDIIGGLTPEIIGLSYYGIVGGGLIALLSAAGSTYCHRILNTLHQGEESERLRSVHHQPNEQTPLKHNETPPASGELPTKRPLTFFEKAALVGDFIGHTGDMAGPITFVGALATSDTSRAAKIGIQAGATFFGMLASVASVRTCKNAIEETNTRAQEKNVSYSHMLTA